MARASTSPLIESVGGYTIGATTGAVNAEFIDSEILGTSSGVAGQVFHLRNAPVVPSDEPFVILASTPDVEVEFADDIEAVVTQDLDDVHADQ